MAWLVALLILINVVRPQDLLPPAIAQYLQVAKVAIPVALAAHLLFSTRPLPGYRAWRSPTIWWGLFSVGVVLICPLSLYPSASANLIIKRYGLIALTVFMIYRHLGTLAQLRRALVPTLAGPFLFAAALVLNPQTVVDLDGRLRTTVPGGYDSNDLGLVVVLMQPLLLYFFLRGGIWSKLVSSAAAVTSLWIIEQTGSRGALISLGVVALYVAFVARGIGWWVRGVLIVAILAGGLALTRTSAFDGLIRAIQGQDYNLTANAGRVAVWKRGVGYALGSPLWGVGPGCFPVAEGNLGGQKKWSTAHNCFVEIAAETGLPLFLCWCAMLLAAGREVGRQQRELALWRDDPEADDLALLSSMVRCALLAYCVGGFFLSVGYFPVLYVLIAYAIALGNATDSLVLELEAEEEHLAGEGLPER